MTAEEISPPVVLIHGLYMGAWAMRMLQWRLQRQGHRCICFDYPTVRAGLVENARALDAFISGLNAQQVRLVGHSLGGRLIIAWLQGRPAVAVDRVVMLGSPLQGSVVAQRLAQSRLGRALIGRSVQDGLLSPAPLPDPLPAIGMLAGSRNVGLGRLVGVDLPAGDGTVALAETRWPGLAEHNTLPTTHTGLLISPSVAGLAAHFLAHGCFG